MAPRSLKACTTGIQQAETKLIEKKWSQDDLAEKVGVDRQTIQKFFRGTRIDRKNFVTVCEVLGINWQVVVGESQPQHIEITNIDALVQQARQRGKADLERRCGWMRVLDMTQPIGLAAIYTDVNILEKITSKTRRDLDELMQGCTAETFDRFLLGKVREERVDGLDAVRDKRQLMILGRPGAGKTTFLKRLATVCNQGDFLPEQLPIFVSLKEFAETEEQPELLTFITDRYFAPELKSGTVDSILRQGRGVILLDGLDEVLERDHDRVLWEVREFAQQYERSYLLVTCRIAAREYVFEQFTEVEVADFSDEQIQDFADKWFKVKEPAQVDEGKKSLIAKAFWQALEERKPVKELAANPLLLTLLCLEFEESSEFPRSRAELYERGLNVLLRKWDGQRRIKRDEVYKRLSIHRKESLLGQLAMQTFERGDYFFKQQTAERLIGRYIQNLPDARTDPEALLVDSQAVLKAIESQHGLLTERATGIYSFSHLTFHEYFAAKNILDTTEPTARTTALNQLVSHITEKRWQEVLLLVAERMDNADHLLIQMKQQIDHLVATDEILQQFLAWAHQKSQLVEIPYKPLEIRAFYIVLAIAINIGLDSDLNLDINIGLDSDIERALDIGLDNDSTSVFDRTSAITSTIAKDIDRDIALDLILAITLAGALDIEHDSERDRERQVALLFQFTKILVRTLTINVNSDFHRSLQNLGDTLPEFSSDNPDTFQQWWQSNGTAWSEQLRAVIIEHRNIGHNWKFSESQKNLLRQYCNGNKLLVGCLNSECYISWGVRAEIEERLLLPVNSHKEQGDVSHD